MNFFSQIEVLAGTKSQSLRIFFNCSVILLALTWILINTGDFFFLCNIKSNEISEGPLKALLFVEMKMQALYVSNSQQFYATLSTSSFCMFHKDQVQEQCPHGKDFTKQQIYCSRLQFFKK